MATFRDKSCAFIPGVDAIDKMLSETEDRLKDRDHNAKIRDFQRRTELAAAEGQAIGAEHNLAQMKVALAVDKQRLLENARSGKALGGFVKETRQLGGSPQAAAQNAAPSLGSQEIEMLAARFARQYVGIEDQDERRSLMRSWKNELRSSLSEFQASEVERKAKGIINLYS